MLNASLTSCKTVLANHIPLIMHSSQIDRYLFRWKWSHDAAFCWESSRRWKNWYPIKDRKGRDAYNIKFVSAIKVHKGFPVLVAFQLCWKSMLTELRLGGVSMRGLSFGDVMNDNPDGLHS